MEEKIKDRSDFHVGFCSGWRLVEKALTHFKVDVVFHAAAYKHVPLVEHNIVAGVRNNVLEP